MLTRGELTGQRVFRGQHDKGRPKQGVGPRREDSNRLITTLKLEFDLGPLGLTNPVGLGGFNFLRPVETWYFVEQGVGVIGNFKEPLFHRLLFDDAATAPTTAAFDLFVGKHGLVNRTPPLQTLFLIGQVAFE